MKKSEKKVFKGNRAVIEYLRPGALGPTPLVELPPALNPFHKDGVNIFIKLAQSIPLANIKSLPSWYMLEGIPKTELKKIKNLVEYSSGNTVMSLAILSRHFGIPNMHAIITPDVPKNKKNFLRLVGANTIISHGPASPDVGANIGGIYEAKKLGEKKGWYNLNQYENLDNPKASGSIIGRELYEQMGPGLSAVMTSLGTGGTVVGLGKFLKKKNPKIKILTSYIKAGFAIPGPRGEAAVRKLAFPWSSVVDYEAKIETIPAFRESLALIRQGFFVGPSTGMQLSAIKDFLKEVKGLKRLKEYKNKNGELNIAFVACDTMFAYIEDYFEVLGEDLNN